MSNGDMDGANWLQNFISSDQAHDYQGVPQSQPAYQSQGAYDHGEPRAYEHPAFDDTAQAVYMYHQSHSRNSLSYMRSPNPTAVSRPSAQSPVARQPITSSNMQWHPYQHMAHQQDQLTIPPQSSGPGSRQSTPGNQTRPARTQLPIQQQHRPMATHQSSGQVNLQPTVNNPIQPDQAQQWNQQQYRSPITQNTSVQNAHHRPIPNNQISSVYNENNSHVQPQPPNSQNCPFHYQTRPPQPAVSELSNSHQAPNSHNSISSPTLDNAPGSVVRPFPIVSQPSMDNNRPVFYPLSAVQYHRSIRSPQIPAQDDKQGQPPAKIRRLDKETGFVQSHQPAQDGFNQHQSNPLSTMSSNSPSNPTAILPAPTQNWQVVPAKPSIETLHKARAAYKPGRKIRNKRVDLVKPIRASDALVKESYNPATIARDVLIAAGRHPTMKGLNHHLQALKTNIAQVNSYSDLATFRWDLVDVEEGPSPAPAKAVPAAPAPQRQHISPPGPVPAQKPFAPAIPAPPQNHGPPPNFAPPPHFTAQRSVPPARSATASSAVAGINIPPPSAVAPGRAVSPLDPTQKPVSNPSALPTSAVPPQSSAPPPSSSPSQRLVPGGPGAPRDPQKSPQVPAVTAHSPRDTPPTRSARIDARAPPDGLSSWGTLPFQSPIYHSPKRATNHLKFPSGLPRIDPVPDPPSRSDQIAPVSQSRLPTQRIKPGQPPANYAGQTPKATPNSAKGLHSHQQTKAEPANPVASNRPAPLEVAIQATPKVNSTTIFKSSTKASPSSVTTPAQNTNSKLLHPQVVIPLTPEKMQAKRKAGRPTKAKRGSAMIEVAIPRTQPVNYPVFYCQWKDCAAELHNMDAMRSHVSKVHIPHHLQCEWKDCEDKEFRAAQRLFEHMVDTHFSKMAWELGDGPTVPTNGDSTEASMNVTNPSARKGTMALPVDEHQVKAFSKAHGTSTERLKARDLFQAGQQWKKKTGLALGPSDSPSSTPDRQANLDCDEVFYISSD